MQIKHVRPRSPRWALWKWVDVPSSVNPGQVYLRRLRVIQTPMVSVFVHWIYEPDTDRYPHDHPWPFCSLVLRGGYTEEIYKSLDGKSYQRQHGVLSAHFMPIGMAHRITHLNGKVVTLIITGRRLRTWCFWTPDGLIEWDKVVGSHD